MRVIAQISCVVLLIFMSLLFEWARVKGYRGRRSRLLAGDAVHVRLALF